MKIWRVTNSDGTFTDYPETIVLDPAEVARGRSGYGIYQAFDESGELIYTGRTGDLATRMRHHFTQSAWWPLARRIEWVPCADYAESVALERSAIAHEPTRWNRTGHADLPTNGRMALPPSASHRLRSLYALTDAPWGDLDLNNYIATLRHAGWTLQSIADPLGITRERVRQRAAVGAVDLDLVVPAPPRPATRRPRRKPRPRVRPALLREMLALKEAAMSVRGFTPEDAPERAASVRYSELIAEAHLAGASVSTIARALGVTHLAVRARLARHGYVEPVKGLDQTPYGQSREKAERPSCHRGHPLSGDNLRLINGDPSRRTCRECARIASAAYKERRQKAGAA